MQPSLTQIYRSKNDPSKTKVYHYYDHVHDVKNKYAFDVMVYLCDKGITVYYERDTTPQELALDNAKESEVLKQRILHEKRKIANYEKAINRCSEIIKELYAKGS